MKIEIIKDQDTIEQGCLRVGQMLDIDTKKAELLIVRGIGKAVETGDTSKETTKRAKK